MLCVAFTSGYRSTSRLLFVCGMVIDAHKISMTDWWGSSKSTVGSSYSIATRSVPEIQFWGNFFFFDSQVLLHPQNCLLQREYSQKKKPKNKCIRWTLWRNENLITELYFQQSVIDIAFDTHISLHFIQFHGKFRSWAPCAGLWLHVETVADNSAE